MFNYSVKILKENKNNNPAEEEFLPKQKKDNVIVSTHHTLIMKDILPNAIPQEGSDEYFKIVHPYVEYHLNLGSFDEGNRGLHELFHELRQSTTFDDLIIRIHSHGGHVDEGKQLYNIINEYFFKRTTTILDTVGNSMGALAFCMGNERIIYENSTLMFHDYSGGFGGKGGEVESSILHHSQSVRNFFYGVVVPNGFLSEDEFESMLIGKDYWMDSIELCERGIATHIMIANVKVQAQHYLMYINSEINIDEMMSGIIKEKPTPKKKKAKKKAKKKTTKKKVED